MVGYGIDNALAILPEGTDETAEELRTLRNEVTRVITELRLSLFELRSEVDRNGGLAAAIAEYARTLGTSAGLRVHFTFDESTARLPAATEAELLRIAQEAITNARRHGAAGRVAVSLTFGPADTRLEVTDDGSGFRPAADQAGFGLLGMRERAALLGGVVDVSSEPGTGTRVAVTVPVRP